MPEKALIIATVGGFAFRFERENIRLLQEAGFAVHYAANFQHKVYDYDEDLPEKLGVKIHPLPISKSPYHLIRNYRALRQVTALIRREGVTLIHCHTPVGGLIGRLAGRRCRNLGVRVIYTAHGFHFYVKTLTPMDPAKATTTYTGKIFRLVERLLARYTDRLIVINGEDEAAARKMKLRPGGQVIRIPGAGLDQQIFRPLSDREKQAFKNELHIQQDKFLLISVGELNRNKNHTVVLRALELLREQGDDIERIRYVICGEGSERSRLEREIIEKHLEDQVRLYGYCDPIWKYTGCADILIFPSYREGLGMAALEGLAMGVPVIAADNRGTREYMRDGVNGWVCRPDDAQGFADSIRERMRMRPDELEQMKVNAVAGAGGFTSEKTREIMKEVYRSVTPHREL